MPTRHEYFPAYEPVAVVGIGCRVPGASSAEELWRLLCEGRDMVGEVPRDRWDIDAFYDPDPRAPGKTISRWGAFVEHVDGFDWRFFAIPPREARHLDPQHRLLLEVAWEALENAGLPAEAIRGRQGAVYIGIFTNDYGRLYTGNPGAIDGYSTAENAGSFAANRLSHFFDLRGPSVAVDATSASSALALHLACRSLWTGEAELALAGGVSLILSPDIHISMSKAGALSPTGRCRTFSADADGMVRGEGAGIVVLEPLSRAIANGDRIYAVIRGTAANHVGRTEWIMAPSSAAQAEVQRTAYRLAHVDPADVDYIELHGTGTIKGDPVEAEALGTVVGKHRQTGIPCWVGSIKTNIGHLDAAAGIMGTIKAILALHHGAIPPSLHFTQPNPRIDLDALGLQVPTELTPWPDKPAERRYAGVTSIGFGGTNVHIVLGANNPPLSPVVAGSGAEPARHHILPISARSRDALGALARAYEPFLASDAASRESALADICYTASVRRSHHEWRLAAVGTSAKELAAALRAHADHPSYDGSTAEYYPARNRKLVFVFPGHGSQWIGMGQELLHQEPVFRDMVQRCDGLVQQHMGWSVLAELHADAARSRLHCADVVQPMIFVIEVALAALWRSWGIVPDAVVGHSMGEIAAAQVAGALSLDDAVRVICCRAMLTSRKAGVGGVAVAECPAETVRDYLQRFCGRLVIAGYNSPTSTLVSGDREALHELIELLTEHQVVCREVALPYASHSHHMDELVDELARELAHIEPRSTQIHFWSTVTGHQLSGTELTAAYWIRNLRQPVEFCAAVRALGASHDVFLEVGPNPVLLPSIRSTLAPHAPALLASLRRGSEARATLLYSLAALYTRGHDIDWQRIYGANGRCVSLPSYPWQRQRLWLQLDANTAAAPHVLPGAQPRKHPFLGPELELAYPPGVRIWQHTLRLEQYPYFADHALHGMAVLPAAAFIEMVLAAASQILGHAQWQLGEVSFERALIVPSRGGRTLQVSFTETSARSWMFRISSRLEREPDPAQGGDSGEPGSHTAPWQRHVTGTVAPAPLASRSLDIPAIRARLDTELDSQQCYAELGARGLDIRPLFRGVHKLWRGADEGLATVRLAPALARDSHQYRFHPAALDPCMHFIGLLAPAHGQAGFVARRCERVVVHERGGTAFQVHGRLRSGAGGSTTAADIVIADDTGRVLCELQGVEIQYLEPADIRALEPHETHVYQLAWEPLPASVAAPERADSAAPPGQDAGAWLILADRSGVAHALASEIQRAGGSAILVLADAAGAAVSHDSAMVIDPADPDAFRRALAATEPMGGCAGIIHLWSLDISNLAEAPSEHVRDAELRGCGAVVHLAHALAQHGRGTAARIWLVTRGAQSLQTPGESPPAALQAPLWGFGRALTWEMPQHWGGLVDLDPGEPSADAARFLWQRVRETHVDDQIARRGKTVYGARLVRKHHRTSDARPLRLRPDATYLITGGLGGLGLAVARRLAERGARRLVLTGRSPFPPRTAGTRTNSIDARLTAQMDAIRAIEALGTTVEIACFDIADENALAAFFATHRQNQEPPIRGVFHAAGVAPLAAILELDRQRLHDALCAKVDGSIHLHRLCGDELDLFVMFSSTAALIGSPRLAHYAAGNAFLDALAHYRRMRGQHALSIQWGPIAEVGLVTKLGHQGPAALHGITAIEPQRAMDLLERLLGSEHSHAVVWQVDWPTWLRRYPQFSSHPLLAQLAGGEPHRALASVPADIRPISPSATGVAPGGLRQRVIDYLIQRAAQVMNIPLHQLEPTTPLARLGLDSLLAVELRTHIATDMGVEIPLLHILEAACVADIAELLLVHKAQAGEPVSRPAPLLSVYSAAARSNEQPPLTAKEAQEALDRIDELSSSDIDRLLARMRKDQKMV